MDFCLALLPCFVIWGLKMKRKEKIVVATGLSLGVFAGAAGIVRTVQLQSLNASEYIYDTCDMLIWSSVEVTVTIMCGSIPVLRALYVKLRRSDKDGNYATGAGGGTDTGSHSRTLGNSRAFALDDYDGAVGGARFRDDDKPGFESRVYPGSGTGRDDGDGAWGPRLTRSEESILRGASEHPHSVPLDRGVGIRQTTDVEVSYSKGGEIV